MNQPSEFFEKAKEFMNNKEYEKALEYFDICYRYDYVREKVLIEKISIFFELKDWQQAEICCLEYIKKPEDEYIKANVQINLAKIYKLTNRNDIAIKLFNTINKYFLKDVEVFNRERLDLSYCTYKYHFKVHEFSGDKKELYNEFKIIKNIPPYDSKTLFFLVRVSNFLHNYEYTKQMFKKYAVLVANDIFYKNAVLNEYEIASGSIELKSFPRGLWLSVSSKCNISPTSNEMNFEMSENNTQKISTYFKYLEHIVWWGGEPTISSKFYKLLENALSYKNSKHTIITNGQYMPDNLVDLIVKNNIEVVLSIDSVEKDEYEKLHKGAGFENLLKTIEILAPIKEKGLLIINYFITNMDNNVLNKAFDFAKKHKISTINFLPACVNNAEKNDFKITNNDIKNMDSKLDASTHRDIFNSCGIVKNDHMKIECKNNAFCHTPWTYMTISCKGTICPDNLCKIFNNKEFILDETNLLDYWNSPYVQDLRKNVLAKHACNYHCPQANVTEII